MTVQEHTARESLDPKWVSVKDLARTAPLHWRVAAGLFAEAIKTHETGQVLDIWLRDTPEADVRVEASGSAHGHAVEFWGELLLATLSGRVDGPPLTSCQHVLEHQQIVQEYLDAMPKPVRAGWDVAQHLDTLLEQHPELRTLFGERHDPISTSEASFRDFLCDMVAFDDRVRPRLAVVETVLAEHAYPDWRARLRHSHLSGGDSLELESLEGAMLAGRYQLKRLIGTGLGGELYEARQIALERAVWVQVSRGSASSKANQREFVQAAARLASVTDSHVLDVFDVATHEGAPFVAAEYVDGVPLAEHIEACSVCMHDALEIGIQLCDALRAIHALPRVVGNLSPADFLVFRGTDGRLRVKLRSLGRLFRVGQTTTGPESARYEAPELTDGSAGPAADVYSVATIILELLVPHTPPDDPDAPDTLLALLRDCTSERPEDRHTATVLRTTLTEYWAALRQEHTPPVVNEESAPTERRDASDEDVASPTAVRDEAPSSAMSRPLGADRTIIMGLSVALVLAAAMLLLS